MPKSRENHRGVTPVRILEMVDNYRRTVGLRAPKDLSGYPVYMLRDLFNGYEPSLVAAVKGYEVFVASKEGREPFLIITFTLKVVHVVKNATLAEALASGDSRAHIKARAYLIGYVQKEKRNDAT